MKNQPSNNSQVRWKKYQAATTKNTLVASEWNAVNNVDEVKPN